MTHARSPQVTSAPTSVEAAGPVITVTRGDTLWGLAERHLGDGHRYAEIYDLNAGRPQADGRALTDPDLIYPGWVFALPSQVVDGAAGVPTTAPDVAPAVGTPLPNTVTPLDADAQQLPEPHGAPDQAAPPNHEAGPDDAPPVNAASDDASDDVPA